MAPCPRLCLLWGPSCRPLLRAALYFCTHQHSQSQEPLLRLYDKQGVGHRRSMRSRQLAPICCRWHAANVLPLARWLCWLHCDWQRDDNCCVARGDAWVWDMRQRAPAGGWPHSPWLGPSAASAPRSSWAQPLRHKRPLMSGEMGSSCGVLQDLSSCRDQRLEVRLAARDAHGRKGKRAHCPRPGPARPPRTAGASQGSTPPGASWPGFPHRCLSAARHARLRRPQHTLQC